MLDRFGFESHRRAVQATASGAFEQELLPIVGVDAAGRPVMHDADEGVRSDVSLAAMAELKPLREGGMLTAATSSQISDGASGVIVVSEAGLKALSLPRSEEHTSELQSLMRISYAVFCLKKKNNKSTVTNNQLST